MAPRPLPLPLQEPRRRLPQPPESLCCTACGTSITSLDTAVSCPGNREFKGFEGKASLFRQVQNIRLSPPKKMLMASGCHMLQQVDCATCESQYLGFKVLGTSHESERWKEGFFLLELEALSKPKQTPPPSRPEYTSQALAADSNEATGGMRLTPSRPLVPVRRV